MGYVYILENDLMPGLIKIGHTSKTPEERVKELSAPTGVPTPFKVAFKLPSEKYKELEKEMHRKLSDYRVNSNREFFEYPVDEAIRLLKKLGTAKQNQIEQEIVKGKKKFIVNILDSFKSFFRQPTSNSQEPDSEGENESESDTETEYSERSIMPPPSTLYTRGYQPLQNDKKIDFDPSLNGKPYYSEQNGFYWAANHHGIAECIPPHIKRIIHNEELEIASTREQLEEEINQVLERQEELEVQKHECEQEIRHRAQQLAEKREELAGLKIRVQALIETKPTPSPVEEIPGDSAKQPVETEIDKLRHGKDKLEAEISRKNQELTSKKEELAGLEVQLEAPTEIELNSSSAEVTSQDATSAKYRFSRINFIAAIIATILFVFLACYLFVFYASAVDKAFFLNKEQIGAQLFQGQGIDASVNNIVNPSALTKAFQGEWNLIVLMFPFVFLAFAIALEYFLEDRKWGWVICLASFTFIFDAILAIQISRKIHEANSIRIFMENLINPETQQQQTEQQTFRIVDLDMWTVIFCGFVVSMLVSIIYYVMKKRWEKVSLIPEKSKASEIRESQIKNERTQREARIAILKTQINNLQNEVDQLNEKIKSAQQEINERSRKQLEAPIQTRIAVLKTEMKNLQNELNSFNESAAIIQQRIDANQAKIEELSKQLSRRVVNRNKMESQVNSFLNGWCRFIVHNSDGTPDVSVQIERIKETAADTINEYYSGAPDYSSQS